MNQAALGDRPAPGKTVLYASVDGEAFAVGTLEKGRTDMFQVRTAAVCMSNPRRLCTVCAHVKTD